MEPKRSVLSREEDAPERMRHLPKKEANQLLSLILDLATELKKFDFKDIFHFVQFETSHKYTSRDIEKALRLLLQSKRLKEYPTGKYALPEQYQILQALSNLINQTK